MSLGWQGESALLPKKSKPIAVDDKSILRLKAAIFDEEQKLAYRNQNKSSRLRSQRGAKSGDKKDIFTEQNKGIQERNLRDEKVEMKVKSLKHVNASLVSKARLYDQIAQGMVLPTGNEVLVNFHEKESTESFEKKKRSPSAVAPTTSYHPQLHHPEQPSDEYSDIEDEFGRTKRVRRDSQDYRTHKSLLMRSPPTSTYEMNQRSDSDYEGPWAWSRGQSNEEQRFEEERRSTKQLTKMIDEGVGRVISSQSRVKSQWEKTLQGESREYLNQIHRETLEMRSGGGAGGGAGSRIGGGGVERRPEPITGESSSSSSPAPAVKTALDERRQLLKRKQLERQKLTEETAKDGK